MSKTIKITQAGEQHLTLSAPGTNAEVVVKTEDASGVRDALLDLLKQAPETVDEEPAAAPPQDGDATIVDDLRDVLGNEKVRDGIAKGLRFLESISRKSDKAG